MREPHHNRVCVPALSFYDFSALDARRTNGTAFYATILGNTNALKVRQKTAFRHTRDVKPDAALLLFQTVSHDGVAARRPLATDFANFCHFSSSKKADTL